MILGFKVHDTFTISQTSLELILIPGANRKLKSYAPAILGIHRGSFPISAKSNFMMSCAFNS